MATSRWPAEWEHQQMAFLGWPSRGDWYRHGGTHAQQEIAKVAEILSGYQPVTVCANPDQVARAREILPSKVHVLEVPYETPYIRDTSPLFVVKEGKVTAVDWAFNVYGGTQKEDGTWVSKWGSLYATDLKDARVAQAIAEHMKVPVVKSEMILEGGSVHSDGEGTLVTTAECLLNKNRNPHMSREEIEAELDRQLGIKKVLWLPRGVYEDWATNGHVDNFCCFVRPGAVLLAWTDDKSDPQYEACQEALQLLESTPDAQGRKLQVYKVQLSPNLFLSEDQASALVGEKLKRNAGDRLPASYINFYRGNGCAVIPAFGEATDEPAREAIQAAYGDRVKVYSAPAREILCGGGNIHCMSMQMAQG